MDVETDGRWRHGTVVRALYLADTAQTAIAEWYRYLAERGLPPSQAIPHDHHIWQGRGASRLTRASSASLERSATSSVTSELGLSVMVDSLLAAIGRDRRRSGCARKVVRRCAAVPSRLGRPNRTQWLDQQPSRRLHRQHRHQVAETPTSASDSVANLLKRWPCSSAAESR